MQDPISRTTMQITESKTLLFKAYLKRRFMNGFRYNGSLLDLLLVKFYFCMRHHEFIPYVICVEIYLTQRRWLKTIAIIASLACSALANDGLLGTGIDRMDRKKYSGSFDSMITGF